VTVNRFCSSGLQTIAMASQRIVAGEGDIFVAGGVESISCVQQEMNRTCWPTRWLAKNKPEIYWNMLQTAEQVAKRYGISRSAWTTTAPAASRRPRAALAAGLFKDEIAPITVTAGVADKVMGLRSKEVTVATTKACAPAPPMKASGICARPARRCDQRRQRQPVQRRRRRLRGDARAVAQRKGLKPLGRFLGFAVAGCEPDEMGIGPVFAVPKVLSRLGLTRPTSTCGN
jgi:acetyl-CoA C-acetyltransferase